METPDAERQSWSERITGFLEAGRQLLSTRAAIFSEELGAKAAVFARGLAGLIIAAAFGLVSLLLFTAWIAALFTKLLGGPVLGILAAFLLYVIVAAVAGTLGVKALSRVKLLEFPVTKAELRKDWDALRASAMPPPEPPAEILEPAPSTAAPGSDDFEARFREGSE